MKTILVIDTKLVYYFQFHRHKHPFNCFQDIANKVSKHIYGDITKVVWVRDEGKSKRTEFYPEYKAHRERDKKKQSKAEQKRRADFEKLYNNSKDFLKYFGSVISLQGYEADDLASIIAEAQKDKSDIEVILISSDEDWARFLYADNIKLLHYGRGELYTRNDIERVFEFTSDIKLFVDSITGVKKENVDGIKNAGKGRVKLALEKCKYNLQETMTLLDEWCDIHKYGMTLPDWADSVRDVYERNRSILTPYSLDSFSSDEHRQFLSQWNSKVKAPSQEIVLNSIENFNYAVQVSPEMSRIFKIF